MRRLDARSDEFGTPRWLFADLDKKYQFVLDAAASRENAKCSLFFTKQDNALALDWLQSCPPDSSKSVFCNPPYSRGNVAAFVRKAYTESRKGLTVVMVLPCRTEQAWFHDIAMPYGRVEFLRKRVRFEGGATSARFPSIIVVFEGA
jgi:site-specific DNA-methyltransferase (adenine-specific)